MSTERQESKSGYEIVAKYEEDKRGDVNDEGEWENTSSTTVKSPLNQEGKATHKLEEARQRDEREERNEEEGGGKEEKEEKGKEEEERKPALPRLSKKLLFLFAFTCFAVVANLYYSQPLLVLMGEEFNKSESQMGLVTTCTQIGYALGLFGITPLGDMLPRKKLLITLGYLVSGALLITGFSVSYIMLCISSIVMGMLTVMTQIIVPLSADLSEPKEQGKTIGLVMSGLLLGILLSRTISGWVAIGLSWRAVYWGACIIMTCTTTLLFFALPTVPTTSTLTYFTLMRSLLDLLRTQPLLWQAGILGFTVFGSFSCFWTTVTFRLSRDPYNYNSGIIGLFSLIGAAGVIGSPIGGFLVDKKGNKFTQGIALSVVVVNMIILTFLDDYLVAMIIAMFFYDLGVQTCQVCNQQRIYKLLPQSKSRVNSIYMVIMFCGGAVGSAVGSWAYDKFGWRGSGVTALILLSVSVVAFVAFPQKYFGAKVQGKQCEPAEEGKEGEEKGVEESGLQREGSSVPLQAL